LFFTPSAGLALRARLDQDQGVVLYGLAELDLQEVVEFYPSRDEAEAALRAALTDEPDWAPILAVARIEYRNGQFEIELGTPIPQVRSTS
jgi:hypothetical protein